jgi:hypothetical protein
MGERTQRIGDSIMSEAKIPYRIEGRDKTIFRTVHDSNNPYVTINSTPITNPALSYKAKGILTYLMSRPDGWEVNVPDLVNHSTDKAASIRTGLNELRAAGHIHYNTLREGGYIKKWIIEVYEIPFKSEGKKEETEEAEKVLDSDFLQVGNQQVENLQVGNRGEVLLSTLSNNELNNKQSFSKEKPNLRGIEAAIALGRPVSEDDFLPELKPPAAILEALATGFPYNFPKYGENLALDRIAKLIVKDGRDIKVFIRWAKANKRDPHWYHIKPDSLWGDWPQAFTTSDTNRTLPEQKPDTRKMITPEMVAEARHASRP